MKILHIIGGGDVGGAKTHVLSLLSRLKEKAEITLICLRHGDFAEDAKKLGINTRVIADKNVLTVAKKVAEMVRAEGYEIVHSHGAKANLTAAFVKRKVKVKLVSTIHSDYRLDYMDNPLKQITFGLMNAVSLRSIDYYTVVSDAMANTLIKRNFNPQAMYTVYNGIDYSDEAVQCSKEQAAEKYGIIPIAGMELTTSEDIHVVCLFEHIEDALIFDEYIDNNRVKIMNKPKIFGNQMVLDGNDELLFEVESLLINATNVSISDVSDVVAKFGGICYPAHIDRESNGIIAILGSLPIDTPFDFYELNDRANVDKYSKLYHISAERFIISSDAHYLTDLKDKENYFELEDEYCSADQIRCRLFDILRRQCK